MRSARVKSNNLCAKEVEVEAVAVVEVEVRAVDRHPGGGPHRSGKDLCRMLRNFKS